MMFGFAVTYAGAEGADCALTGASSNNAPTATDQANVVFISNLLLR